MAVPRVRCFSLFADEQIPVLKVVVIAYLTARQSGHNDKPATAKAMLSVIMFVALMDLVLALPRPFIEERGVIDLPKLI